MRRKGFTLIELLVVIAIIAILAAILFPVFLRAKVTANTTRCMSHGRELGVAMSMYMDDNAGRFPSGATDEMMAPFQHITWSYHWPAPNYPDRVWSVSGINQMEYIQLAPYVKNTQIWVCPSPTNLYSMKYAFGYRCSWFFHTGSPGASNYPDTPFQDGKGIGMTLAEVQAKDASINRYCPPSKKFFAWCYALGEDINVMSSADGNGVSVTPAYAHDEGSVYVFADSHARYREMGCGFAPVRYTDKDIDRPHTRH